MAKAAPHLRVIETVDNMAKLATEISDYRIAVVLARAREAAVRRSRACELKDSEVELCLKTFMDSKRKSEERARALIKRFKADKKLSEEAKAAAEEAKAEMKKQKLALAAERLKAAACGEKKYFSAEMLGANREHGGTKEHRANRLDLLERVRKQFPPLPATLDYEDFQNRLECRLTSVIGYNGKKFGNWLKEQMDTVIKEREKGDMVAFERWVRSTADRYKSALGGALKA